ncbi:hypothetical protein B0H34DRAFT_702208 [Crassisporium funariophilum]|nr:hypothetical protein B0H34DRAFT_702208 [Crassisporium funariophilum]
MASSSRMLHTSTVLLVLPIANLRLQYASSAELQGHGVRNIHSCDVTANPAILAFIQSPRALTDIAVRNEIDLTSRGKIGKRR